MEASRTMHLYMDGFASHKILDSDKKTVLYRTHRSLRGMFSSSKVDIEVYRVNPVTDESIPIGSITWTSVLHGKFLIKYNPAAIEMKSVKSKEVELDKYDDKYNDYDSDDRTEVDNSSTLAAEGKMHEFTVERDEKAKNVLSYISPRPGAGRFLWDINSGVNASALLIQESDKKILARFERVYTSFKKFGRVKIFIDDTPQDLMDEVMFTGAASFLFQERNRNSVVISGSSASAAAGGGGA